MNSSLNHYVYCHYRLDTNTVFYIGKGQNRRAYSKQKRNAYWSNIVKKAGGFRVEILADKLLNTEALKYERVLITALKKKHHELLCNLTDGGEGGLNPSFETRQKQRNAKLGKKLSEEHKRKIGEAGKERIFTAEARAKISQAQLGRPSKYKGIKRSPEVCLKISEAKKAKNMKHSEETKLKMSLARQGKRNL
jgi:hypothetical protein